MRIQDKKSNLSSKGNRSSITIHACAESGDLIGFRGLLEKNPSLLNERSILMLQTPLHIAAGLNRVDMVKYLLNWKGPGKVELEAKNVNGETPLHAAAKNGCNEMVKMLLDYGANVEARTNNLISPLRLAIGYALRSGDNLTVNTLKEYNADRLAKEDVSMFLYAVDYISERKISLNYPPASLQNEKLVKFRCQSSAEKIYDANEELVELPCQSDAEQINDIEQSNYSTMDYSWTDDQNFKEPKNYDNGLGRKMNEFDHELSKIVGLHQLKLQLRRWAKGMLLDEKRREMGINLGPRKTPHMAFLGNPGTGKTTVARILGKLLKSVGVISSDNVTEVQRTDLVGEYIGQTGPKTRGKIEEAKGGILFIDEAYRLAIPGKWADYGVEALEEIMSVLEDGNLVVVFAGYTEPMKRVFSSNAGFCRRVTHFFEFEDFTCKDLAEMVMIKMTKQDEKSQLNGFKLHPLCTHDAVVAVIEKNSTEKLRGKMNGGLVDHMLNNAREHLDSRLTFDSKGDELLIIMLSDLEAGLRLLSYRMTLKEKEQRK
ncbi:hypothetical protein CDL12_25569 [Handroanthus impetiginosus]|uniref:AAA+ ATPase domain-containing protein n=1 Tax=Handroanthus impetiginosus TaxID=429701 RepID=A0A2G9G9F5_9LAMI|nr:hypothetical protein CDL12_25569 [Handroanthus impetiginosus]